MLKDYGHHWHDAAQPGRSQFAAKVKDVSEFLDQLGLVKPPGELRVTATYHDACHLAHAQRVREQLMATPAFSRALGSGEASRMRAGRQALERRDAPDNDEHPPGEAS